MTMPVIWPMTIGNTLLVWLAVNAVCLWIAIAWAEATTEKRPRAVAPLAAAIIVPIACLLGAGVLLLGIMAYLTLQLWWDSALLKLISWLIRKIPRDDESVIKRRALLWATKRLSAHVNRWLRPGAN